MTQTLTATCPACSTQISEDDRTCAHCGAGVSVWAETPGRAPLILPGNTGLSADMFRGRVSLVRIAGGTVVGAALLGAVLLFTGEPADDEERESVAVRSSIPSTVFGDTTELHRSRIAQRDSIKVATVPATVERAPVVPTPAPEEPVTPAPVTPRPEPVAAAPAPARVVAATAPAPDPAAAAGVLRMLPVVSDTMRPGELLQLRWTVRNRATGRPVPASVEFTSTNARVLFVDRRTGAVTAVNPGRASIIADAGRMGRFSLALTVRATPLVAVVATQRPAPAVAPAMPRTVTQTAPAITASPVSAPTVAPAVVTVREAPRPDLPSTDEIRSVVDRFVASVRSGGARSFELSQFLADGDGHKVSLASGPNTISSTLSNVRVTFEMRLSKYDAAGRPMTRMASVSMDIDKRDSGVSSSAVAIGALRRP